MTLRFRVIIAALDRERAWLRKQTEQIAAEGANTQQTLRQKDRSAGWCENSPTLESGSSAKYSR